MSGIAARTAAAGGDNRAFFTKRTLPTSGNWNSLAYNGSVWIAVVPGSTQSATSTDGNTWTSRTLPVSLNWNGAAAIGSTFVLVAGGTTTYLTSTDGINWTQRTMPVDTNWKITHYSGTLPSAILAWSYQYAAYTTNGTSWTLSAYGDSNLSGGYWQTDGSAYNGSMWIIAKDNFAKNYYTSTNGTTWTKRDYPDFGEPYMGMGQYWAGLAWTGTYWIIGYQYGELWYRSTNGINWEICKTSKYIAPFNKVSITPQYNPAIGGSNGAIQFSVYRNGYATIDGEKWVKRQTTLPYTYGFWNSCAYGGGKVVWVGGNGACVSGPDVSAAVSR